MGATAIAPATRLGGGSLVGWNGIAALPLGEWTTLETSVVVPSPIDVGSPSGPHYRVVLPGLAVRTELTEGRLPISLGVGGGMFIYRRSRRPDTAAAAPAATNIPAAQVILGSRLRVWRALALEVSVRDWLTVVRDQQLVTPHGSRGFAQSFDIRLALVGLFGSRPPAPPRDAELPLAYSADLYHALYHAARRDLHTGAGASSPDTALAATGATRSTTPAAFDDVALGGVYFASGSAEVETAYRPLLERASRYLTAHPGATLVLTGYADSAGTLDPNVSLAERRSTAVADLLVRLYGVAPRLIATTALGVDYRAAGPALARRTDICGRTPRQTQP